VIEMAQASGIEHLRDDELNPMRATTYGTGELLQAALDKGGRRFIIGMGGSATVDGGAGALQALGIKLLDSDGDRVPKGGGYLRHVKKIDASGLDTRWNECEGVIIASDVANPVLGEDGAARVFAPQKGATGKEVDILAENLRHFFSLISDTRMINVRDVRGGGAAGGLAAGLMAFLGGQIESGIDLLLSHHQVDRKLETTALVITGEGQMDGQTIYGKGPVGIARRAKKHGVPTVALVGGLDTSDEDLHEAGIQAVLPIITQPMTLDEAIDNAALLLERAALRLGYLVQMKLNL
jgi:glycerate kinase